ncbi:MAG: hypothetical protein CMI18_13035 [Opitutaceae bacterium]|nr:hypothetical protein [Opitutaceae bacterium]
MSEAAGAFRFQELTGIYNEAEIGPVFRLLILKDIVGEAVIQFAINDGGVQREFIVQLTQQVQRRKYEKTNQG